MDTNVALRPSPHKHGYFWNHSFSHEVYSFVQMKTKPFKKALPREDFQKIHLQCCHVVTETGGLASWGWSACCFLFWVISDISGFWLASSLCLGLCHHLLVWHALDTVTLWGFALSCRCFFVFIYKNTSGHGH